MFKLKPLALMLLGLSWSAYSSADDFEVDGIYYNYLSLDDQTVEVTYRGNSYSAYSNEYAGTISIPESITYRGVKYSVTSIGDYTFSGCSNLTNVEIPSSVTNIDSYAFYDCDGITAIDLPNSITKINTQVFYDCDKLISINIPNSVTSVGDNAFAYCDKLASVNLGDSLHVINSSAFYDCNELTNVEIPATVKSIGSSAFYSCDKLKSVVLGDSLSSIGSSAFYNCSNLKVVVNHSNLEITAGSSSYGYVAYYAVRVLSGENDNGYYFKEKDGEIFLTGYWGEDTALVLPELYEAQKYSIGKSAFSYSSNIISVKIPNSVTKIGSYAFKDCDNLKDIEIGDSVTNIGEYAFYDCDALEDIEMGNSVTSIETYAFYDCDALVRVIIPNSVTIIKSYAFQDCDGLVNVVIGNAVKTIESYAFNSCDNLRKVFLGKSVSSIGSSAFNNCSNLKTIINNSGFNLSKNSSSNGYVAYYADYVIAVQDISGYYFGVENGKYMLSAYLGNESVVELPDSCNGKEYGIYHYAFFDCKNITSIEIPNNVTSIGSYALARTSITTIEIPTSVELIGNNAFTDTPLRTIVSKSDNPATLVGNSLPFCNYTYIHAPLYVPEGAYWNYAYATGWGDFIHIKEMATEVSSLQSRKAYMIADTKGCNYKVYDAEKDALKTVEYTHALDEESEGCCWTVMKENDNTYLYNLGAKKFGVVSNDGVITLSETPVNVTISENEDGLSINGANCMFVLNKNIEVDVTDINDVLCNGIDMKEAQIHSLDGRRQQHLTRGINIVNGKKVLVK